MKNNNVYTFRELAQMDPFDINTWLIENFIQEVPENIENADDMMRTGTLLARASNQYSYLVSMYASFKIYYKQMKRGEYTKQICDDMMIRKDLSNVF